MRELPRAAAAARVAANIVAIVIAIAAASCSRGAPGAEAAPPVPVTAAPAAQRDVPVEIRAIGSVQPHSNVEVRAQVGGVLETVHFREGQDVRKGDLLFSLDARPYAAALKSAEAALARDQVQMETARRDMERYGDLVKKEYVTRPVSRPRWPQTRRRSRTPAWPSSTAPSAPRSTGAPASSTCTPGTW
jgi:multidrug efflux system membrane fusion protein